jgi:calcium-dependent protein kinase
VLTTSYNEKCDVWSIGAIMYIMLSGKPPFDGIDDKEIIRKVKKGEIFVNTPDWKKKSKDSIDLLKKMMTKDPVKRVSADDALQHIWIRKVKNNNATKHDVKKALD